MEEEEPVEPPSDLILATAELVETPAPAIARVDEVQISPKLTTEEHREQVSKVVTKKVSTDTYLSDKRKSDLITLLTDNQDILALAERELGMVKGTTNVIDTGDAKPNTLPLALGRDFPVKQKTGSPGLIKRKRSGTRSK